MFKDMSSFELWVNAMEEGLGKNFHSLELWINLFLLANLVLMSSQDVMGKGLGEILTALRHLVSIPDKKTRDLFKKIRDSKGTFHAKMGTIKDRNSMDLTEAEDIKKRWQEYTEELYKKDLTDPDNHNGVITNLEPDILEWEVKSVLRSIAMNKASGGDGIPVEK